MKDIRGYHTFQTIKAVDKGWSNDEKYYIETVKGEKRFLRVADLSHYDRKQTEFKMMKQVWDLRIPMPQPLDFGICGNGKKVYTLFTWCEGEDAEHVLPQLTEAEQYELGVKTGERLKLIHSIPAPKDQEEWSHRFNRKTNLKLKNYQACGVTFAGDDKIMNYIENHRHLLSARPQSFHHGDYHVGNMVISANQELSIIDFDRYDFGDPWEEFNRIVWSAAISPHFATGQLNGYFGGKPPVDFFKLLAFYISSNTLSSVAWAITYGDKEMDTMMKQAKDVLAWFDNMNNPVPTWYLSEFHVQYINHIPYKLKAPFDMSFIQQYGKVFKIYDDQDSGNICFGVQNGEKKHFIKFAGAPTEQYTGTIEDAIERLEASIPAYQDLKHSNLIKLIKTEKIGCGFAMIFEWFDGECMGRMYPLSRQKFMKMSYRTRLKVFDEILSFHAYVATQGYVAIDFYDGSIMFDFSKKKTVICDIDFYAKAPYINQVGRMWGSSRFMSPEEFSKGSVIDEITNVYLMGATAFALFANYNRTLKEWPLSEELYNVALKAINYERNYRQQSIKEFIEEWNQTRELH